MRSMQRGVRSQVHTRAGVAGWGLLLASTALAAASAGGPAHATPDAGDTPSAVRQAAPADVAQSVEAVAFDVPAQPLARALTLFGRQADLQVAAEAGIVAGITSPGVGGRYTPAQALRRLLAGTGLDYRFTAARAVTIERSAVQPSGRIELSPISVVGQLDTGYGAKRAVSATRTAADRDEIPVSVEVYNKEMIENQGSTRVGDVLRYGSGLVNDFGSHGNRFTDGFFSRGFGSNFTKNGVLRNRVGANNSQDAVNIERLEVLKGPASVLYGQLEPGGVVNVVTKQPLSEPFAEAAVHGGSFDFKRVTGDISAPLDDEGAIRFRINAAYEDTESFKDFYESEHIFIAPVLAIDLGPDTRLTLEGEYSHDDSLFTEGIPLQGFLLPNVNGQYSPSLWIGEPDLEKDVIDTLVLGYRFEHRFNDRIVLRNAFRWERFVLDEATVVPTGLQNDQRTVTRAMLETDTTTDDFLVQTDLVTEFATGVVDHELVTGFDYRNEERDGRKRTTTGLPTLDIFNPVYGTASAPSGAFNTVDAGQEVLGFYVQDRLSVGEDLTLLGGARYDRSSANNGDDRRDDNEISTQFGIVYQLMDPLAVYANRTESFVPQFGNTADGSTFPPEFSTQYEIGTKLSLLDDKVTANLAAFQITKENVETTDPNDLDESTTVGEARSQGIELSLAGELRPGWNVTVGYGFTETEITRDFDGNEGNKFLGVPQHNASLSSRYDLLDGDLAGLGFSGGIAYVGSRYLDNENSAKIPSYVRVDMGLHYRPVENVDASLFVENVLDEEYAVSGFGSHRVNPGAPRTFRGRLTIRF